MSAGNKPIHWDDALTDMSETLYNLFKETSVASGEEQLTQRVDNIVFTETENDRNNRVLYEKSLSWAISQAHSLYEGSVSDLSISTVSDSRNAFPSTVNKQGMYYVPYSSTSHSPTDSDCFIMSMRNNVEIDPSSSSGQVAVVQVAFDFGATGVYTRHITSSGSSTVWVKLGGGDLTNVYTKTEVDSMLSGKVDKVTGKGLSSNDYTTTEKTKLAGIESGAEVNVQSDWNTTDSSADSFIKNKPTIPTKTSDLTNDSDFVSDSNYVHTDNNFTNEQKNKIQAIENKIPSQASSSNQLADKAFVNSSIGTNTANYISNAGQPFTSLAQLQAYTGTVTNNDYAFVTGTDSAGNTYFDRYKATVSGSSVSWAKEYRLNNSSFTAVQWEAISSGITALLVQSFNAHLSATNNPHNVTASQVGAEPAFSKLPISKGGTNATTAKEAQYQILNDMNDTTSTAITDSSKIIFKYNSPSASTGTLLSKSASTLWNYIKGKCDALFATISDLGNKVDKVSGKGLSTNDYTTTEKNKLAGIETGANKTTIDSSVSSTSTNPLQNKVVNSSFARKFSTTMVGLGFTAGSTVDVGAFLEKIRTTYGSNCIVNFGWSDASGASITDGTNTTAKISGYTLFLGMNSVNTSSGTWQCSGGLLVPVAGNANMYVISCTISATAGTISSKKVIQLSNNGHTHSASSITSGTLPTTRGGSGTSYTDATALTNGLINSLTTGSSAPVDADYYVSQYAGGGTSTTTYHRRPMSALWNYISSKLSLHNIGNANTVRYTTITLGDKKDEAQAFLLNGRTGDGGSVAYLLTVNRTDLASSTYISRAVKCTQLTTGGTKIEKITFDATHIYIKHMTYQQMTITNLGNNTNCTVATGDTEVTGANTCTINTILNKSFAIVATSGSYNDLTNKPTIPAAQVNSDWNATSGKAQILNKPTIPAAQVQTDWNATSGMGVLKNKPSTFPPSSHNQASNTINAMTGYSKPSATSAITTSDTLNQAIGKLEAGIVGSVGDKMDKRNPVGTGSFSMNRRSDTIIGSHSHAEGYFATASGNDSHAEGTSTTASGEGSHAEGDITLASGHYSHAEGSATIAKGKYQHAQGTYNVEDTNNNYADIIGNGTETSRKNIEATTWTGDKRLKGDVYLHCNDDSSGGISVYDKISLLNIRHFTTANTQKNVYDFIKGVVTTDKWLSCIGNYTIDICSMHVQASSIIFQNNDKSQSFTITSSTANLTTSFNILFLNPN